MIIINKKYKINGTGPFDYTFTSPDPKVSFKPVSGTTTSLIDVQVVLDKSVNAAMVPIELRIKTKEGCSDVKNISVTNPCIGFATNLPIIFSSPDKFTLPSIPSKLSKINWVVGSGLKITAGQGTESIIVEETGLSSASMHQVLAEVISPEGCIINLSSAYHVCDTTLDSFSVAGSCGKLPVNVKSKTFLGYGHKTATINLKTHIDNQVCVGCTFDYNTIKIVNSTASAYNTTPQGLIDIFDTQFNVPTTYTFTIMDSCKKIYSGIFAVGATACNAEGGCYNLTPLPSVAVACTTITGAGNQNPTCGMTVTGPQYELKSAPVNGNYSSNLFNWNDFQFIIPTQGGVPKIDYAICSPGARTMITPYGILTLNNNNEIIYKVTKKPAANTNISETIPYQLKANPPSSCTTNINNVTFDHTCLGDPIGTAISDCATCFSSTTYDMTSFINMQGLSLIKLEAEITSPLNNVGLAISTDILTPSAPKITLVVDGVSGTVKFRYRATGQATFGNPPRVVLGSWVEDNIIEISCAGKNASIIVCS